MYIDTPEKEREKKEKKRNENKVLKVMAYHVSVGVHFVSK